MAPNEKILLVQIEMVNRSRHFESAVNRSRYCMCVVNNPTTSICESESASLLSARTGDVRRDKGAQHGKEERDRCDHVHARKGRPASASAVRRSSL